MLERPPYICSNSGVKIFIDIFDRRFNELDFRTRKLIEKVPYSTLFAKRQNDLSLRTCGEHLLRSAGKVEQTFGGITTRLWDDPFEWTLAEELSTAEKIVAYLDEVVETRRMGFNLLTSDEDLAKKMPAPEELKPVFEILLETLVSAEKHLALAEYESRQLRLDFE